MKRIGVILLILVMLITIVGGPLSQQSNAIVISAAVIGAVIAVMGLFGITIIASGITADQLKDYVSDKLETWSNSIGTPLDQLLNSAGLGITVDGLLICSREFVNGVKQFMQWFQQDQSIVEGGPIVTINYESPIILNQSYQRICSFSCLNDNNCYYEFKQQNYTNFPCYCVLVNNWDIYNNHWFGPVCISKYQLDVHGYRFINGNNIFEGTWTLRNFDGTFYVYWLSEGMIPSNTVSNVSSNTMVFATISDAIAAVAAAIEADRINNSIKIVPSQVIDTTAIPAGSEVRISTGALPGTTIVDIGDEIISATVDNDSIVSGEESEIDSYSVYNGNIVVTGLQAVFPFCIPFDIYDLLSCLSADPETPVFTVRFVIPGIINEEFTIDLTPFNAVAQIVRTMEMIVFAIGLALVTRERFLRS